MFENLLTILICWITFFDIQIFFLRFNVSINKSVTVKILGKDYQIACTETQTHNVIEAALLLDSRMKEIRNSGRVIGSERIAVMAALNLAHEFLELQEAMKSLSEDTDKRLFQLSEKLANALAHDHQ